MKKTTKGRKIQKAVAKLSKKGVSSAKKISNRAKGKADKVKIKTRNVLGTTKKKLNAMKKKSFISLPRAKKKIYATEEEIMDYVKDNPIKSISAVALTGLIAGFLTYRYKK
jgi:ElaB/YqjD/DUF883 family membrane-anchored ribosome-binding protein